MQKGAEDNLVPKDLNQALAYRWLLSDDSKEKLDELATYSHETQMAKKRASCASGSRRNGKKKTRLDDKATADAMELFKKSG